MIRKNIKLVARYKILYFPVGKRVVSGVFHVRYIIKWIMRLHEKQCKSGSDESTLFSKEDISWRNWITVKYSKICLKRSLKNRQNKGLKDKW